MIAKKLLLIGFCLGTMALVGGCVKPDPDSMKGLEVVSYTESDAVIPNPERGFYSTKEAHSASTTPISASAVELSRKQGRTLYLFEYYLTDYVTSDIAEDYLNLIRKNFQTIRENGAKALIRFAYSNGHENSDRPWDATEEQVLRHVADRKSTRLNSSHD